MALCVDDFRPSKFEYEREYDLLEMKDRALKTELYHVRQMMEDGSICSNKKNHLAKAIARSKDLTLMLEELFSKFYGKSEYVFGVKNNGRKS